MRPELADRHVENPSKPYEIIRFLVEFLAVWSVCFTLQLGQAAEMTPRTMTLTPPARDDLIPMILVVGDKDGFGSEASSSLSLERTAFTDFSGINAALKKHKPDIVLSPLFAKSFDANDLAVTLHKSQFDGRFRVLINILPDFDLILSELRQVAPKIDIDFMVLEIAEEA